MRSKSGNYRGKHPGYRNWGKHLSITWYVVANRTGAVVYGEDAGQDFHFIKRLSNPRGHRTESELDSDRPGRGISSGGKGVIHHGLDRRMNRHERIAHVFAGKIAKFLGSAHASGKYNELVIVSEPHFLGLLRTVLSPSVKDVVQHEIHREYAQGSDAELQRYIHRTLHPKVSRATF